MPAIKLKKVTAEYLAEKEREAEKLKNKTTVEEEAAAKSDADDEQEKDEDTIEEDRKNFLKVEILYDKRKRTLPVAEQKLIEWLEANFEKKEDKYLPLQTLYEYYSEVCEMQAHNVVDVPIFNKYVRDKFGKTFGFQANSPYNVLMKERKVTEKKPKVQGETLQIKLRDVINSVVNDLGNPLKGVSFQAISKAIVQKYPAQRMDMYPKKLKSALQRGIDYRFIELVRGVGLCGYYRLPGEPTKKEDDKKKKDTTDKKAKDGATENGDADGESAADSGVADSGADKSEDDEEGAKKEEDDAKEAEEGASEDAPEEQKKKQKKKTKKPRKRKAEEVWARKHASKHSDPQHVADTFPLAITYQSDPKEASGKKIQSYIAKFYHNELSHDRLKKSLDSGLDKGLWEQSSGSGFAGKFHLLSETFQPGRSDQLSDQISQAILACSEPKTASAGLIKKYITQYHPALGVESKPHLLKNALEKECSKGVLKRLSGIGASGSFQLVEQFYPSPVILAGDSSDEEEDDVAESSDGEEPLYVPRPTKRGRSPQKPKSAPSSKTAAKKKGRAASKSSSPAKGGKRKRSAASNSEEEEEENSEVEEAYTPKASKSRGAPRSSPGKAQKGKPAAKKASPQKGKPATPAKRAKPEPDASKRTAKTKVRPNYQDDDSEDEVTAALTTEYLPMPSRSRGGGSTPARGSPKKAAAKPASAKRSGSKAVKRAIVQEDVSDEEEEEAPPPKKARGASAAKSAPKVEVPSESEEEIVLSTKKGKVTSPKSLKGGKKKSSKKRRR